MDGFNMIKMVHCMPNQKQTYICSTFEILILISILSLLFVEIKRVHIQINNKFSQDDFTKYNCSRTIGL